MHPAEFAHLFCVAALAAVVAALARGAWQYAALVLIAAALQELHSLALLADHHRPGEHLPGTLLALTSVVLAMALLRRFLTRT